MNVVSEVLQPGTVIQDTYKITKLLGEGGMGATFEGRNLATDHDVAIKVISASFAENKRAIDLFKREANLLRSIQHEAVVRYETTLQDKDGRLYLVMEMLHGQPLSYYIEKGARLSPEDVLKLGRRLASGLDTIASVGTVHRDIAPDNIFVPDDDIQAAKLIDFGLASNTVGTEKTILGDDFAGKFSYCAPEQLGMSDAQVSPKTDAYALGLVLMKIAGLPIPGEGEGMRAGIARREDLQVPSDRIGPALSDVLSQLLKANPDERPSPLTPVFDRALAGVGQAQDQSDKTRIAVEKVEQLQKKSKLPLIAAGVVVLAAIGAGAFFMMPETTAEVSDDLQDQITGAEEAIKKPDPLEAAKELQASSDLNDRNAALAVYLKFGGDAEQETGKRIEAFILAAEMADPKTFDASKSAFGEASARTALRFYKEARDLGDTSVNAAIARLEK